MSSPPIDIPRPATGLARGVRVSRIPDGADDNPEPIKRDPSELILEEYLSPRRLREMTGVDNLEDVTYLEMKVDTTETTLGNFAKLLPNLKQLKLTNSHINSLRDIGSGMDNVEVLWMSSCELVDIDGIACMNCLKELYLAYNKLTDISPISMLDSLETLDLEGNLIEDFVQIEFLGLCSSLQRLSLEGNPVTGQENYRDEVLNRLPSLTALDDTSRTETVSQEAPDVVGQFQADWELIDEFLREGAISSESTADSGLSSPGQLSATSRPATAASYRPITGHRPATSRPATSRLLTSRPSTAASRPSTTGSEISDVSGTNSNGDVSSALSRGDVICGNPGRALRRRSPIASPSTPPTVAGAPVRPSTSAGIPSGSGSTGDIDSVFSELQQWRRQYELRRRQIEEDRKPQVMTITYEEPEDIDDDDEEGLGSSEDEDEATGGDTVVTDLTRRKVLPDVGSTSRVRSAPIKITPGRNGLAMEKLPSKYGFS